MLDDIQQQRAMANCDYVRRLYNVRFLQVMPDPKFADNVHIRIGKGTWTIVHVLNAAACIRKLVRKERRQNEIRAQREARKLTPEQKKVRRIKRLIEKENNRTTAVYPIRAARRGRGTGAATLPRR